jgi:hypothetical protein
MYARVTLAELDTVRSSLEDMLERYTEQVVPLLREQEGYQGVICMDTPDGKALVMTLWDTAEQANSEAEGGLYSDALARFVMLFKVPPGRGSYRIAYAEVPSLALAE